jgi:hypothetical protein
LARLDQSFQITNPNSMPLTISLYNAVVWTPGGHFSGNFASGDTNAIHVTDGTYDNIHAATGANAYQAAQDATLTNLFYGGPAQDLRRSHGRHPSR